MEQSEFDKLIHDNIANADLHDQEIDKSQPFVWTEVRNNQSTQYAIRWYHLAAAVILLLLSFGFILRSVQGSYNNQIGDLSEKISQLETNYLDQTQQLDQKQKEIQSLGSEIADLEGQLEIVNTQGPAIQTRELERLIYQTDTVYLTEVKYITEASPTEETVLVTNPDLVAQESVSAVKTDSIAISSEIFASNSTTAIENTNEGRKVRLGIFLPKDNN